MERIKGKWIHDGKEYEVVDNGCLECCFLTADNRDCKIIKDISCLTALGVNRCFKLKEPKMKKEELNFKVLTPTVGRARAMLQALADIWVTLKNPLSYSLIKAIRVTNGELFGWTDPFFDGSPTNFDACLTPEVTFAEALELLKKVEPEREFNIKPFDRILRWSARGNGPWKIGLFSHPGVMEFEGLNSTSMDRVVLFEGNEHLRGKSEMPDGWWECREGKPVWRSR